MREHEFVILNNEGELEMFSAFEDVPATFRNLIAFHPHVPDLEKDFENLNIVERDDHSLEVSEICHVWHMRFRQLITRETH